jgi:hypothetical protein
MAPNVRLVIKSAQNPNSVVVVGAHLDSRNTLSTTTRSDVNVNVNVNVNINDDRCVSEIWSLHQLAREFLKTHSGKSGFFTALIISLIDSEAQSDCWTVCRQVRFTGMLMSSLPFLAELSIWLKASYARACRSADFSPSFTDQVLELVLF